MYKAVILPFAKHDIKEAALWYNDKQNGLGKIFTQEIRKKIAFLKQNPASSPIRYDNVKTAVLDIFPYMVHYSIDTQNKLLIISAVLHTSRDPDMWQRELLP